MSQLDHPVLIVGAGPTGLTLAITLRRYGVPVRIIDQKMVPHQESRSLGIHSRTLEVFDQLGLSKQMIESGQKISKINLHFNKKRAATLDFSIMQVPHPYILILPQNQTEHHLIEKLHEYDVKVERSTHLKSLKSFPEYIQTSLLVDEKEEVEEKFSWVIGCDGYRSSIRKYLGADFTGYEYPMHFSLADVYMETSLDPDEMNSFICKDGAQFIVPIKDDLYRIISQRKEEDLKDKTTLHKLEEMVSHRSLGLFNIKDVDWLNDFKIQHRISSVYRKGRLFIAGDAAHVHSPVGGQGMNMGIQDAFNLGWKLAYVICHQASSKLLASYSRERMKIAQNILNETEKLTKIMTCSHDISVNYYRKMIQMIQKMPLVHGMVVYQFSGIANRYKNSPIISSASRWLGILPSVKAGCRFFEGQLRHLKENKEVSTFDLISNPYHHLFLFFKKGGFQDALKTQESLESHYGDLLKVHLISTSEDVEDPNCWLDLEGKNVAPYKMGKKLMVLVRPDGYIGLLGKGNKPQKVEAYFQEILGIH